MLHKRKLWEAECHRHRSALLVPVPACLRGVIDSKNLCNKFFEEYWSLPILYLSPYWLSPILSISVKSTTADCTRKQKVQKMHAKNAKNAHKKIHYQTHQKKCKLMHTNNTKNAKKQNCIFLCVYASWCVCSRLFVCFLHFLHIHFLQNTKNAKRKCTQKMQKTHKNFRNLKKCKKHTQNSVTSIP
jgi:hypothetical protein